MSNSPRKALDNSAFFLYIPRTLLVRIDGVSSSGKTAGFGPVIRGFESYHPNSRPPKAVGLTLKTPGVHT